MDSRSCTKCFIEKPIEEFPWKNRLLGKRHAVCKECTAQRSKRLYSENKQDQIDRVRINKQRYRQTARDYTWEYLSTHPCSQCGESDPIVLEFHHVGGKDTEVSRLIGYGASIDVIKAEIARCVVLCASCHRRVTAKEQGWYRGKW
jgi:hypothetical protein